MRQLVTMRHPIGFILFGALVAVVVQPAFGAIVGSRIQAEGMTESSSDIAVQDDGAGDEGDHLRFANSATSSQRASITVNPGQQVDEIQIRSRQVSGGSGVMAFYVDGTASGNQVATFTPADGSSFTTQTLTLSSPMSAGSHTIYLGPNATLNAVQKIDWFELHNTGGGGTDTTPLETRITSADLGTTNDNTPTFTFSGTDEAGVTGLECRVYASSSPAPAFSNCASPYTTATLSDGNYVFEVRAKDAAGNVDATPASDSFTVNTVVTSNSPFPGIRYYSTMGVYEGARKGFLSEPSLLQDQYNTYVGSASENAYLDLDNDATRYYFCGGRKYEWTDMLVNPATAPASSAQARDPNWSNYKWNQTDVVDQMLDNSTAAQQDKAKVCMFVATSATANKDPVPTYVKNGTSYYGNGLTWTDGQGKVHVRLDKVGGQQAISDFLIALTKHYGNDPRIASITNGEWYTNSDAGGLPTGFDFSAFKTGQKAVWQAWVNSAPKDANGNRVTLSQIQPIVAGGEVSAADIQNIGIGISGSGQTVFKDGAVDAMRRILYGVVPLSHQVNLGTIGTNVTFDNTPNPFGYAAGSRHPATYPVIAWFYDNQGLIPNSNAEGSKVPLDSINMGADPTLVSQWHSAFDQFGPNGSEVPTWGQIPNIP
jgi:hypothetical protein